MLAGGRGIQDRATTPADAPPPTLPKLVMSRARGMSRLDVLTFSRTRTLSGPCRPPESEAQQSGHPTNPQGCDLLVSASTARAISA